MPRDVRTIDGLCEALPLSPSQAYKLTKRLDDPLPFKKVGKRLWFDMERVYRWLDRQPGSDGEDLNED